MTTFTTLREANAARQAEWDKIGGIDLAYRGNEMAGEIGEVFAIAFSVISLSEVGLSTGGFLADFADELADVVICVDLIALAEDLPPVESAVLDTRQHYDVMDRVMIALSLGAEAGQANNVIKKLVRERRGIRGSRATREQLAIFLSRALANLRLLAWIDGIDLDDAVQRKFNSTSEKVGLSTRLVKP